VVRKVMSSSPSPSLEHAVRRVPSWLDHQGRQIEAPKAQSVGRWVNALKNLERIEDDTADEYLDHLKGLREAPVAAAELICRWHRYDAIQALDAAQKVVRREWRIERLREEEAKARKETGRIFGRQYAYKLRRQATDWAVPKLADFALVEEKDRKYEDPPVDLLFNRKDNPKQFAAVLIFGPYTNPREYETRRSAFLSLTAGVALYMMKVLVIVPSWGQGYWRWLHDHHVEGGNIEMFVVGYHGLDFEPIQLSRATPPLP